MSATPIPPPPRVFINSFSVCGPGFGSASGLLDSLISKKDVAGAEMQRKYSFDNRFFQLSEQQADSTDPQLRLLLELTYEALSECGVDDLSEASLPLRDTGVYVGSSFGDFHNAMLSDGPAIQGDEHIGAAGAMLANGISRHFGFCGPSMKVDSACSSGLQALNIACDDLRSGKTKMAVVCGANLILNPMITAVYERMTLLSASEPPSCKAFSAQADGYVRQEAIVVLVLSTQNLLKACGLHPVAEVLGNCSLSGSGASITAPCPLVQEELYRKVAAMATHLIDDGSVVSYVECHATGTKIGDEVEMAALASFMEKNSSSLYNVTDTPILVGSVKSNIGHSESASGLVGLVKVLLSLDGGSVPPNLHYSHNDRNRKCGGLDNGVFKVVETAEPIKNDAIAVVNSFGFGGTYVQVMVKGCPNKSVTGQDLSSTLAITAEPWRNINPLVGRSIEAAHFTSKVVLNEQFDFPVAPPKMHRGPSQLGTKAFSTVSEKRVTVCSTDPANSPSRPVWVIFSGNGGNWSGTRLLDIYDSSHCFKETYDRCHSYLLGAYRCSALFDLVARYRDTQEYDVAGASPFRDALEATVCLTALQICLIDTLRTAQFSVDNCEGFIGHSAGEIAAGYFDGSLSLEQTLDVAAMHGHAAVVMAADSPGAMYAVRGLTKVEVMDVLTSADCPVDIACHNGPKQVTLSGQTSKLYSIKENLEVKGGIITPLETHGAAFHSRLVTDPMLASLKLKLDPVFLRQGNQQKYRSAKWMSTCADTDKTPAAPLGSGYYCDEIRNCVDFVKACTSIPDNAIIIECGPCALFRSILANIDESKDDQQSRQRVLLSLLERGRNGIETVSNVYGHLFLHNVLLSEHSSRRSPKSVFAMPSQRKVREAFVVWDHSRTFSRLLQPAKEIPEYRAARIVTFDLESDATWLRNHRIDGRSLVPAAVYLYLIWEQISLQKTLQCTVVNFRIHQPVDASQIALLQLGVVFSRPLGVSLHEPVHVEVVIYNSDHCMSSQSTRVASATITGSETFQLVGNRSIGASRQGVGVDVNSLYHRLGRYGYEYQDPFRVISAMDSDRSCASLRPCHPQDLSVSKALILAIDGMLQFEIARNLPGQYGPCELPYGIERVNFITPPPPLTADNTADLKVTLGSNKRSVVLSLGEHDCASFEGIQLQKRAGESSDASVGQVSKIDLVPIDPEHPISDQRFEVKVCEIMSNNFDVWTTSVRKFRRAELGEAGTNQICMLVSRVDGFAGFVRSLQKEPGYAHIRGLQVLHAVHTDLFASTIELARQLFAHQEHACCLFADLRSGTIMTERSMPFSDDVVYPSPHGCFLAHDAETIDGCWKPISDSSNAADTSKVVVEIEYASINFRDAMIGSGKLRRTDAITGYGSGGGGYGLDFAGSISHEGESGRVGNLKRTKVIGLGRDCIADNIVDQPRHLLWHLDADADLEKYSTVPCAFATAYYALCVRGRLQTNDKVLVHCGAGGVGLAALRICTKRLGDPASQLFVTCGSSVKRQYLHDTFSIPMQNIGDSRSEAASFKEMVLAQTSGQGVNLVLNSVAGLLLQASVECLAFGGVILELGKSLVDACVLNLLRHRDRQLVMIDLDQLMDCPSTFKSVWEYVNTGLQSGEVAPLRYQVFSAPEQIPEAFDCMLDRLRIGKVVLKINQKNICATVPNIKAVLPSPAAVAPKQQVFIIAGGLGGLGLCLAQWLAAQMRSACRLLLLSSGSRPIDDEQQHVLQSLRDRFGTTVLIHTDNFCDPKVVADLLLNLRDCEMGSEIVGFFNLAATTKDGLFDKMDATSWANVFAAKRNITENFSITFGHTDFAELTSRLRYFVCISSVVVERGNAGQCNYASANATMESIVLKRVKEGLPGLCVRLGLIHHTGIATTLPTDACCYAHLSPLDVGAAMTQIERLIVGEKSGLWSIYGKSACATAAPTESTSADQVLELFRKHVAGGVIKEHRLVSDHSFDSMGAIILSSRLKKEFGIILSLEQLMTKTPLEIARLNVKSQVSSLRDSRVVVISTIGKALSGVDVLEQKLSVSAALRSIQDQNRQPDSIIIVFEGKDEMVLSRDEVLEILPSASILDNKRSNCSTAGALNTGIVSAYVNSTSSCIENDLIAFLDTATHRWSRGHLEHCLGTMDRVGCWWVLASSDKSAVLSGDDPKFFVSPTSRSSWLLRCSVMMEAGLFDEALQSTLDYDMSIRVCDTLPCNEPSPSNSPLRSITCIDTVENHELNREPAYCQNDVDLFLYKHCVRMNSAQYQYTAEKLRYNHIGEELVPPIEVERPECQYIPLNLWSDTTDGLVSIRRDTHEVLSSIFSPDCNNERVSDTPRRKTLVGITTGDTKRIAGLLGDLGCMLDDHQHCVVVFANSNDSSLADHVLKLLHVHEFRCHVIRPTDRIVKELYPAVVADNSFPLPIARSRTVLQTFLHATTKVEHFDTAAVLDDDIRLPRGWGDVHDTQASGGDVLLGRAIKTPPNVTAMSMRTQLLDFLYALDILYSSGGELPFRSSMCPSLKVFSNLHDQYYDLSAARWDHLEVPRYFKVNAGTDFNAFVKQCQRRILVGDPLAREAVSTEEGSSYQRGGCMMLLSNNFDLLSTEQRAPSVKLASDKIAASRRSDTFWVQYHCLKNSRRAVALRQLSFVHDNTHDSIPSPEKMREAVTLEMIGAILCRPISERAEFSRQRTSALRFSIARIRGLCKALKNRHFFDGSSELQQFVADIEERYDEQAWQREVFEVIEQHVEVSLKSWSSCDACISYSSYELNSKDCAFLATYPTASDLKCGPQIPIPCLHRIHLDADVLEGAHKVQAAIGMSLPLSEVQDRLRQLSKLTKIVQMYRLPGHNFTTTFKSLVTIDDGFRDVLLLRSIFAELSETLQPVVCVPSAILRDDDTSMPRRHLPLTCLYKHCDEHGIQPTDKIVLGTATRFALKAQPEQEQYCCLRAAGVSIDLPLNDLLSKIELQELSNEGWWICTHGPDHSELAKSSSFERVLKGLKGDFERIRKQGWAPWFAWPEGSWSKQIVDSVADKRSGATVQFGLSPPSTGELPHASLINRAVWYGGEFKPRILVTGSSGFLGKHLVLVLTCVGFDVECYDISDGSDILNRDQLVKVLRDKRISICVHLAAVADLNVAEDDPVGAKTVNVEGTRVVLECCDLVGVRLLFASTCCVYGNNGVDHSDETSPVSPTEIYAETKLEGEKLVLASNRREELHHVVMRLATFYGPEMRSALATSLFLNAAERRVPIRIHGDGMQTRCFTHVHDIAEGIRVIVQTTGFSGIVNVADNREVSVNALADIAMRITGNQVDLIHEEDRKGQIHRSRINNDCLRALGNWGWTPTVSLEDGLRGCRSTEKNTITISEQTVKLAATCKLEHTTLPTMFSDSIGVLYVTESLPDGTQMVAYVAGAIGSSSEVAVRLHSECFSGDVLGSMKCDCGPQKSNFLSLIGDDQPGILIYIKGHEGRGTGIVIKTRAYGDIDKNPWKHHNDALLDAGATKIDARHYDAAAEFTLRLIREHSARTKTNIVVADGHETLNRSVTLFLYTNNPDKVAAMTSAINKNLSGRCHFRCKQLAMPVGTTCTSHNRKYLKEKEDNGHVGLSVDASGPTPSSSQQPLPPVPISIDELAGVTTKLNETVFAAGDLGIDNFVKENGFVIIRGLISTAQVERMQLRYEAEVKFQYKKLNDYVGQEEISLQEYSCAISQFRDLFLSNIEGESNIFHELVYDRAPNSLGSMARRVMTAMDPLGQWDDIRLLHDHIITKPAGNRVSKEIPLHQDRMFWPVDIPGCSTWMPMVDVPVSGGCMELFSLSTKPHLGPQSVPGVDFMADETQAGLKLMCGDSERPVRWLLPMKAGDTLIFSSHAWHRSSPNKLFELNRAAYIQTWVHPRAHWRPDLVPWHPVNEHLSKAGFKPGECLRGQRHPTVGLSNCVGMGRVEDVEISRSIYARDVCAVGTASKATDSYISMFDASNVVITQLNNILLLRKDALHTLGGDEDASHSLSVDIRIPSVRRQIVELTEQVLFSPSGGAARDDAELYADLYEESGCSSVAELLSWVLKRIMISVSAYACNRSRNVFNSAFSAWWSVAGAAWNRYFLDGRFRQNYQLCKTDVERFLDCIKVSPSGLNKLDLLTAIIRGCLEHIPFQNFTMLTRTNSRTPGQHSPPTLGEIIKDMTEGLGGLCSSRNPFLYLLLKALKYDDVRLVSGTMCFDPLAESKNAHTALLVRVDSKDYWVDVANGWPYLSPIALKSADNLIQHPFVDTRLVKKVKHDREVLVVEHLRLPKKLDDWKESYYFEPVAVDYDSAFTISMQQHYDNGPFLKNLRFNMWSETGGILLRDRDICAVDAVPSDDTVDAEPSNIDLWDKNSAEVFASVIKDTNFAVDSDLVQLVRNAWFRCQENAGVVTEAQKITVTGGFFGGSADGYIGLATIWRICKPSGAVAGMTFSLVKEYQPEAFPVINKGFAGGSWYNGDLYVCWPNRVAVISPASDWTIKSHIDNPGFNDLHHVHTCNEGVWVANTGNDSVDHLTMDGRLLSRFSVVDTAACVDEHADLRSQVEHDKRRGHDKEHVNYVSACEAPGPHHLLSHSGRSSVMATLLQSKQVIFVGKSNSPIHRRVITRLPQSTPPHEGFLATVPSIRSDQLLWNSTVDGQVIASDPISGTPVRTWDLSKFPDMPRGWTRGLLLLDDGFLVGSTAIRGEDANCWIRKHDNVWNFDTSLSKTSISFVPYDVSSTSSVPSVIFLTGRGGKVFSLLHTPDVL